MASLHSMAGSADQAPQAARDGLRLGAPRGRRGREGGEARGGRGRGGRVGGARPHGAQLHGGLRGRRAPGQASAESDDEEGFNDSNYEESDDDEDPFARLYGSVDARPTSSPSLSRTTKRHQRTSPVLGFRPAPTTQARRPRAVGRPHPRRAALSPYPPMSRRHGLRGDEGLDARSAGGAAHGPGPVGRGRGAQPPPPCAARHLPRRARRHARFCRRTKIGTIYTACLLSLCWSSKEWRKLRQLLGKAWL